MSKADHVMEKIAKKKRKGLTHSQKDFIAGTVAGAGATAAFYPLDTIITSSQAGQGKKLKADLNKAKSIMGKAKRLYRGLPIKILKNAPTSGLTLMLYGAAMRALGGNKKKKK
tara:strand:- start:2172 stop:2510 length:339 start_codon:yes stop_codon:yes gene_type:complete